MTKYMESVDCKRQACMVGQLQWMARLLSVKALTQHDHAGILIKLSNRMHNK